MNLLFQFQLQHLDRHVLFEYLSLAFFNTNNIMSFSKIIAICIEINILIYYIPDNKMPEKDNIISKIYHEFYGSINNTYLDARKEDKTITYDDVKKWFDKSFVRKTNLKGYNSYVAHHAFEEFQMDLFFINDLEDQEYKIGLLIVDTFSKYLTVVPLDTQQTVSYTHLTLPTIYSV